MRTKQLLRRSIDILNDQTPSNIKKSSQKIMYLIGEDSGATQFVEHQIQSLGYEILLARNQSEAIAIAKYWKPLVIISEISLNNLKGFELCRLLKEDARTNSIPFFFISDQKVKPDQLLGFQMGADDYIIKPWEPNEFRSRLLSLIRRNTSEIKEESPDFSDNKMNNDKGSTQLLDDEQNDQEISVNIHRIDQNPSNTDKEIQTSNVKHKYEDGKSLYKSISVELANIYSRARKIQHVDILRVQKIAKVMVESLEQSNDLLLLALHERDGQVIIHDSINVTIYSILVGKGLNYSQEQLTDLTTASLINDIGFVKLPERLVKPNHNLSEKEIELIQMHPIYGAQIVKASLNDKSVPEFAWLQKVLLQVHEREGGVGYPKGIKGNEINEFAKVIGIADTFNALLWEQTYKKGSVTYQALQKIIEMDGRYFSQKIKKALVSQISIFPLGTYVKLNSEQIGLVVDINKSHPTRPVIELLFDSQRSPMPQRERKDLSESPFLYITRVVSPDEIHNHGLLKK